MTQICPGLASFWARLQVPSGTGVLTRQVCFYIHQGVSVTLTYPSLGFFWARLQALSGTGVLIRYAVVLNMCPGLGPRSLQMI